MGMIPSFSKNFLYHSPGPVLFQSSTGRGTEESHRLVRLYLTIFSIGRIVKLAKPVSKGTYKSIISPPADMDSIRSVVSDIKSVLPNIINRYIPLLSTIPRVNMGYYLQSLS